jgi:hypothetical protein
MSSFATPGPVQYKFNTEEDFAFYILNAVGHDFIHDFNNYGRMGKILQYIMSLVEITLPRSESGDIVTYIRSSIDQLREVAYSEVVTADIESLQRENDEENAIIPETVQPVALETSTPSVASETVFQLPAVE